MDILVFEDDELDTLYSVINKLQLIFHPYICPNGELDFHKIMELQSSDKDIIILVDNNLASPICEIARNGYLKNKDRMYKMAALILWAQFIGAKLSCGFSLFETDSQKLSCYTAESSRLQFLHAVDNIPAHIWKALAFGNIDHVPSQYLSSDYKTDERNFEYNEGVLYLSTEAAIIKIVELLRKESVTAIEKFVEFTNWYADNLMIAESILFYAAAVFANVPNVAMPKKCKSSDFSEVIKGIKNQAWDLTYIVTWSTVYSNETIDKCYMFATDDITQKVIIVNTIPPGECLKALYSIFTTKKEIEMLNILFESKFGKSRILPMKELNDDENVKNIKAVISEECALLQKMIQE